MIFHFPNIFYLYLTLNKQYKNFYMSIDLRKNRFIENDNSVNAELIELLVSDLKKLKTENKKLIQESNKCKIEIKKLNNFIGNLESKIENKNETIIDFKQKLKESSGDITIYKNNEKIYKDNEKIYQKNEVGLKKSIDNILKKDMEAKNTISQLEREIDFLKNELKRVKNLKWFDKILGK